MTAKTVREEEWRAIPILSIGTFLEYFDFMLYVHMAVLLNDLFFSKSDDFSASLLSSFAFCATFIFRPVGGLLIGWLGDTYGRRSTVIITSFAMALSCLLMFFLPTYQQVGIVASWAVTACRIVQGISSMGEIIGAQLYLTELIKPPKVYPAVSL
jgi:MHS family proline/betaine transporter-like MFS transporter